MKVMIPCGVGILSVAINGTMIKMAMTPTWTRKEVMKLAMDLPTDLPPDSDKNCIISLGTVFCAPFLTGGSF
jgi:hypothetical protein